VSSINDGNENDLAGRVLKDRLRKRRSARQPDI
jgi:hypothetical protein